MEVQRLGLAPKLSKELVCRWMEKWLQQGVVTLHDMYTHGFRNLFFVGHARSGAAANFVFVLDVKAQHVAHMIQQAELQAAETEAGVVVGIERECSGVDRCRILIVTVNNIVGLSGR